jgi:alkylated DNA repair dioxygenase AlkB
VTAVGTRPLVPQQRSLFDLGPPDFDRAFTGIARTELDEGAWVDHLPRWVHGHESLLETLWSTTRWQLYRRRMYDRVLDVPRLIAVLPEDGPGHPLLPDLAAALSTRYGRSLHCISLAAYRDGRDSVAFHGDRLGHATDDAIVALVSLGAPRRFLLRRASGGAARAFGLGRGDLLVMGGTCQRTWQHSVPKVVHAALRITVQFRSASPEPARGERMRGPADARSRSMY